MSAVLAGTVKRGALSAIEQRVNRDTLDVYNPPKLPMFVDRRNETSSG